jgi:hypothetical protein
MSQDPQVRSQAAGVLSGLFHHLGTGGSDPLPSGLNLGAMGQQVEELIEMPIELAQIFLNMSTQLTELILTALEQAGLVLAKGLLP